MKKFMGQTNLAVYFVKAAKIEIERKNLTKRARTSGRFSLLSPEPLS
jgi:hypothetical protein